MFPLPCELPPEHCFDFRVVNVIIGDVPESKLAGDGVQDEATFATFAEVGGSSTIEPDDRGVNRSLCPYLYSYSSASMSLR